MASNHVTQEYHRATDGGAHPPDARPIEVGDYVWWERGPDAPWNWAEGEVVEVSKICIKVLVQAQAPGRCGRLGERCWLGIEKHQGCTIRRIPRPGAGEQTASSTPPIDPLDVEYDGEKLRVLLKCDEMYRRADLPSKEWMTPVQRAAVSAHWSAELRAKVAAAREQDERRVLVEVQEIP